jgi:hypothetical protein
MAETASWLLTRQLLRHRRFELGLSAAELYSRELRVEGTPLLAPPEWLAAQPIPLGELRCEWDDSPREPAVTGREPEFASVCGPASSYSEAMARWAPPRVFENRFCYGLREVDATRGRLVFGPARYFDSVDIAEAVAHEYAMGGRVLRDLVGDPHDLSRRRLPTALAVLVIRHDAGTGDARMLLHWRDPAKVASGGGLTQVVPVGIFQPSDDAPWNLSHDFDPWRGVLRELNEELLGGAEDYGSAHQPIDYDNWPLAQRLSGARCWWLGAGIDPLTLVCDQLLALVLDCAIFDEVFAAVGGVNDEGHVIDGIPFTAESIARHTAGRMQPAGAALLRLAWRFRDVLLGEVILTP